jgi:hypothetical protein
MIEGKALCVHCGADLGRGGLDVAVQITAVDVNSMPQIMFLCLKPEDGKITGCARRVLSRAMLKHLYDLVDKATGEENSKPFAL